MIRNFTVVLFLFFNLIAYSSTPADSLVKFSDLSFHSDFEKQSFVLRQQGNDLNLCLASDKNMTEEKAAGLRSNFEEMIKLLDQEKITPKNIRQKYKNMHKIIFSKQSMQYYENAEFSDILKNGYFNYLTSSILFSLALKELHIPSTFLFTFNKTDIIINPDADQVILESINRKDENGYFNTTENKGFIVNMLDKNIRIGSEYKYNASEGNVAVHFKESDLLKNNELVASIYLYIAMQQMNAKQPEDAYNLIKKACYLFPDEATKNSMFVLLSNRLERCDFNKVEDIDLLGQLLRFKQDHFDYIVKTFENVMGNKMYKQNDLQFCKDIYNRLLPQIEDASLATEISYLYYMFHANYNSRNSSSPRTALQALKLKPYDKAALKMIEMQFQLMEYQVEDKKLLLDSLNSYEKDMINTEAADLLKNAKVLTYLDIAKASFESNQGKEGLKYITLFESIFKLPLPSDISYRIKIENAYYEYARYSIRFNNRALAQKIVDKGCQYIPNSNMIQSAIYNLPVEKPKIYKRTMTKTEYDKYMKKNGPDR